MTAATTARATLAIPHQPQLRLRYLDGMRGLAAAYVVVNHLHFEIMSHYGDKLPFFMTRPTRWLQLGHFAVGVFIVLSGYSLMLPVVRSKGTLAGGMRGYVRRRARRILPPYFATLFLLLLVIVLFPVLQKPIGGVWDGMLPNLAVGPVVSHLLLIHNLREDWAWRIDAPMWSVATEWQIYFVFPLLLLPLWRRWGITISILTAFAVGWGLDAVFDLSLACPWYLGLFALGMGAAVVGFPPDAAKSWWRGRIPWGTLCVVFAGAWAATVKFGGVPLWEMDVVLGLSAAAFIVMGTQRVVAGQSHWLLRGAFETRIAVWLGAISYSMYLIHDPIIAISHLVLRRVWHPAPIVAACVLPFVVVPLVLAATYVFHLLFERPFMRARVREARIAGVAPGREPAI